MMLYSAFIVGLMGSLHCLGMCGPIALALPVNNRTKYHALLGRIVYNSGRILMYSLLGFLMGAVGQSLAFTSSQQQLSIVIGVVILVLFLLPSSLTQKINPINPISRFTGRIKQQFSQLIKQKSNKALFLMGLLNGLLPCGLVYVALAGAIAMGSSINGLAYMALFGLGTLPIMLAVAMAKEFISVPWRVKFSKVAPVFTIVLAFLFILRGMNLGIPILSPKVEKTPTEVKMNCCHKK